MKLWNAARVQNVGNVLRGGPTFHYLRRDCVLLKELWR